MELALIVTVPEWWRKWECCQSVVTMPQFCCHSVDPTTAFNVTVPGYSLPNVVFSVCMDCCCIFSAPGWASYKLHHSFITSESRPFVVAQIALCENFTELQLAQTATLVSLQTNRLKGATTTKATFCVRNSSINALVCKLFWIYHGYVSPR